MSKDIANQLFLVYLGRPADVSWRKSTADLLNGAAPSVALQNAFFSAAVLEGTYSLNDSPSALVNKIFQNIFGFGANGYEQQQWGDLITKGVITAQTAAWTIFNSYLGATNLGSLSDTYQVPARSKLIAVDAYTTELGNNGAANAAVSQIGGAGAAAARATIAGVTSIATAAPVVSGISTTVAAVQGAGTGSTYSLTAGVDAIVGTAGNDTINAVWTTAATASLGGLDSIDGGLGTDSLNIGDGATAGNADYFLPAFTLKGVEVLKVTTTGALGTAGGTVFDISGLAGVTSFTGSAAGTGTANGSTIKVAATTDVNLTVASANSATVSGGKVVSVTSGTGAVSVTGSALTSVTVTSGGATTIDNTDATGATSVGTTLTSAVISADAAIAVKGGAITTLTLSGQGAVGTARTVTVTNGTAGHSLTINAAGTGYQNDTAGTEKVTTVTEATATAVGVTINTTAKSSLDLSGITTIKSVTLTGSGALKLAPFGAAVTAIDGSAATGGITLGNLNAAVVSVKTGAGNDSMTVNATAKATVDTGAGNDTVTQASALAAGSTITLGAGDDKYLFGTGGSVAASTATAVTSIDGGDGTDTLSANLVNAGNAGQFKNFESLSLDSTTGLDLGLLSGNTLTALSIDGASTSATYQNVKASQALTITTTTDNSAVTNTLTFTGVSGTSDAYTITFNASAATAAPTAATVKAGTIAAAGIENFTIVSGGTNQWNSLKLGADTAANSVTVTGGSNLDLTFAANFGQVGAPNTGVSSIDGSAATGKLAIDITNVTAATAGLTVKGGSAADTITTSNFKTTLTGGAGADTFVVTNAAVGTTLTAPVITTITDATAGDKITLANVGTEVFTTAKVDVSTATALVGGTVNALELASTASNAVGQIKWFQYGGDTYLLEDNTNAAAVGGVVAIGANDVVVKLTGLIDLSTAVLSGAVAGAPTLTLA